MQYRLAAIIGATALALLGYKGISEPQDAMPKLGYIDSTQIIEQTPGAGEAQATFDREMARWQSEVQVLADSLQQMIASYEQQQTMLSPQARQARQDQMLQKRMNTTNVWRTCSKRLNGARRNSCNRYTTRSQRFCVRFETNRITP